MAQQVAVKDRHSPDYGVGEVQNEIHRAAVGHINGIKPFWNFRGNPVYSVSKEEMADRLAIRELVDAYAHCADRLDANGQMALFTPDTHFVVYTDAKSAIPSQELHIGWLVRADC